MHRLDETLLAPKGQAGVCYSRNNKIEPLEEDKYTEKLMCSMKYESQ